MGRLLIHSISQLITPIGFTAAKGKAMDEVKIIEDAYVLMNDDIFESIGYMKDLPVLEFDVKKIDGTNMTVMPGLIDAHTHLIFGKDRIDEFKQRLNKVSYEDIMAAGGGIVQSIKATQAATLDQLVDKAKKICDQYLLMGVTTLEAKSGYGATCEAELKQLEAIRLTNQLTPIELVSTFMGLHYPSKDFETSQEYVQMVIDSILPEVAKRDEVKFVDAFLEANVFSAKQVNQYFKAASKYGFSLKLHMDELNHLNGAKVAIENNAISVEHCLVTPAADQALLAKHDVIAVLLPLTAFSLNKDYAPARSMIEQGLAVAVATDFNPGSNSSYSIPNLMAHATLKMGLTMHETITALTLNAAAALKVAQRVGSIEVGKQADCICVDYPNADYMVYYGGINAVKHVIKNGKVVVENGTII